MAGVEPWGLLLRKPWLQQFLLCLSFWWSRRDISEVSTRLERWRGMVCAFWGRNGKEPRSRMWSLIDFKTKRWPREQQAFISRTHKGRFKAALASAVITSLMAWSQVSFWRPFCLAWTRMQGFKPSWNRQIKTGSEITALASDFRKTVCKCSRWAAQSITSFNWCWKSFLIVFPRVLTKTSDSLKLWRRKALNLSQLIGTLVWSLRWYCCQRNRAVSFKKIAANRTRFRPVAPAVAKWSLHCWKKL